MRQRIPDLYICVWKLENSGIRAVHKWRKYCKTACLHYKWALCVIWPRGAAKNARRTKERAKKSGIIKRRAQTVYKICVIYKLHKTSFIIRVYVFPLCIANLICIKYIFFPFRTLFRRLFRPPDRKRDFPPDSNNGRGKFNNGGQSDISPLIPLSGYFLIYSGPLGPALINCIT